MVSFVTLIFRFVTPIAWNMIGGHISLFIFNTINQAIIIRLLKNRLIENLDKFFMSKRLISIIFC